MAKTPDRGTPRDKYDWSGRTVIGGSGTNKGQWGKPGVINNGQYGKTQTPSVSWFGKPQLTATKQKAKRA